MYAEWGPTLATWGPTIVAVTKEFGLPLIVKVYNKITKSDQCADSIETMWLRGRYERLVLDYRRDLAFEISKYSIIDDFSPVPDFETVKEFFEDGNNDAKCGFIGVTLNHFGRLADAVLRDSGLFSFVCGDKPSNAESLNELIQAFDYFDFLFKKSNELEDGVPVDDVYPLMLNICQFMLSGTSDANS